MNIDEHARFGTTPSSYTDYQHPMFSFWFHAQNCATQILPLMVDIWVATITASLILDCFVNQLCLIVQNIDGPAVMTTILWIVFICIASYLAAVAKTVFGQIQHGLVVPLRTLAIAQDLIPETRAQVLSNAEPFRAPCGVPTESASTVGREATAAVALGEAERYPQRRDPVDVATLLSRPQNAASEGKQSLYGLKICSPTVTRTYRLSSLGSTHYPRGHGRDDVRINQRIAGIRVINKYAPDFVAKLPEPAEDSEQNPLSTTTICGETHMFDEIDLCGPAEMKGSQTDTDDKPLVPEQPASPLMAPNPPDVVSNSDSPSIPGQTSSAQVGTSPAIGSLAEPLGPSGPLGNKGLSELPFGVSVVAVTRSPTVPTGESAMEWRSTDEDSDDNVDAELQPMEVDVPVESSGLWPDVVDDPMDGNLVNVGLRRSLEGLSV